MRHLLGRDLTIRPARDADRPALLTIWRSAVDATHHFLTPEDRAAIDEMVVRDYFPHATFTVAADAEDRPVGFIELDDPTTIGALFVDPAQHGRGIGWRLAKAVLPSGAAWEVEVNEANAQARAVYERWGFRVIARRETDAAGRPYPLLRMRREVS